MKIRIKFTKTGVLKYIGHLDLMRYFQKALRRTDIKVEYSKGFSPHMIMSFAQPLGVGIESFGEYFDLEVDDTENIETIKLRLNETQAEGITIEKVILLKDNEENAMASVKAASYRIDFYDKKPDFKKLSEVYDSYSEINYIKTTKTGDHQVNIKDFTYDFNLNDGFLNILLDASSANNLKPLNFISALFEKAGLNISEYKYHIFRLDLFTKDSEWAFISLGDVNEQ